jgi:flagellar motility protein MotE (MotC chaperone)
MSFKIRPLAGIAVALGALGLAQAGRLAFDATSALAAGEPTRAAAKAAPMPATDGPAVGPPMCLPVDLAKEAGISAAEFRLLQSLQERRQTLDARERDIVTRENVIKAADGRIQERMTALKGVEGNIQKLLGQVDELEAARIASLVAVYEKMKPKDAARILEGLDTEVLIKIAQRMKTQPMALILANMSGERARMVTQRLAEIDSPDLTPMTSTPPVSLQNASPTQAPAARPANPAAAAAAAASPLAKAAPASGQPAGAALAKAAMTGVGPTSPTPPQARAPNAPNTPQPTTKAASGQAPADPATRARAGTNQQGGSPKA